IVSHDRWFLDKVATAILAFEGDGKIGFYEGDYSAWAKRAKAASDAAAQAAKPAPKAAPAPAAKPAVASAPAKKLSFKERHELDNIEAAIATAEARVEALQATLNDPTIYKSRAAEVPAIVTQLDAAKLEVDRLYARWQALEALK
ncbi:MAG TPA: ABC transporter ATP-binding protein, partial [Polyangia bacterium]|nr:ABC transporter ATP-binding protein [Polyangia bacterium]